MTTETWTSDKGNEEIHHFLDGKVYLWGFNKQLLGQELYDLVEACVESRLDALVSEETEKYES